LEYFLRIARKAVQLYVKDCKYTSPANSGSQKKIKSDDAYLRR